MTAATRPHNSYRGWVLYDGGCGICARSVPFWAGTLERLDIGIAPLQAPWIQERLALTPDVLMRDIRLLFADGRQFVGADVYRYVMRHTWWAFPFYLLAITPGLRSIFNAAYRVFAEHRHRLSASCGIRAPLKDDLRSN